MSLPARKSLFYFASCDLFILQTFTLFILVNTTIAKFWVTFRIDFGVPRLLTHYYVQCVCMLWKPCQVWPWWDCCKLRCGANNQLISIRQFWATQMTSLVRPRLETMKCSPVLVPRTRFEWFWNTLQVDFFLNMVQTSHTVNVYNLISSRRIYYIWLSLTCMFYSSFCKRFSDNFPMLIRRIICLRQQLTKCAVISTLKFYRIILTVVCLSHLIWIITSKCRS